MAVAALPTPADLVERLRSVYNATSDEDLARRLDVPVRRLAGYKAGKGMPFWRTVDLLNRAGWLSQTQKRPSLAHLEAAEEAGAEAQKVFQGAQHSQDGRERGASKR